MEGNFKLKIGLQVKEKASLTLSYQNSVGLRSKLTKLY